jgi:hypothetical protein
MGRANLQKLFRNFVSSSNRASLSLLSMPYDGSKALLGDWNVSRPYAQNWGFEGEVGWLNTGDAELLGSDELTDWAKSYADELPTVRVLALPHHGSDRNSNVELQKLCPNATFVAHVKSNSRKHPGPRVALAADQRLVRVTEQPRSEVYMSFQAPWK